MHKSCKKSNANKRYLWKIIQYTQRKSILTFWLYIKISTTHNLTIKLVAFTILRDCFTDTSIVFSITVAVSEFGFNFIWMVFFVRKLIETRCSSLRCSCVPSYVVISVLYFRVFYNSKGCALIKYCYRLLFPSHYHILWHDNAQDKRTMHTKSFMSGQQMYKRMRMGIAKC